MKIKFAKLILVTAVFLSTHSLIASCASDGDKSSKKTDPKTFESEIPDSLITKETQIVFSSSNNVSEIVLQPSFDLRSKRKEYSIAEDEVENSTKLIKNLESEIKAIEKTDKDPGNSNKVKKLKEKLVKAKSNHQEKKQKLEKIESEIHSIAKKQIGPQQFLIKKLKIGRKMFDSNKSSYSTVSSGGGGGGGGGESGSGSGSGSDKSSLTPIQKSFKEMAEKYREITNRLKELNVSIDDLEELREVLDIRSSPTLKTNVNDFNLLEIINLDENQDTESTTLRETTSRNENQHIFSKHLRKTVISYLWSSFNDFFLPESELSEDDCKIIDCEYPEILKNFKLWANLILDIFMKCKNLGDTKSDRDEKLEADSSYMIAFFTVYLTHRHYSGIKSRWSLRIFDTPQYPTLFCVNPDKCSFKFLKDNTESIRHAISGQEEINLELETKLLENISLRVAAEVPEFVEYANIIKDLTKSEPSTYLDLNQSSDYAQLNKQLWAASWTLKPLAHKFSDSIAKIKENKEKVIKDIIRWSYLQKDSLELSLYNDYISRLTPALDAKLICSAANDEFKLSDLYAAPCKSYHHQDMDSFFDEIIDSCKTLLGEIPTTNDPSAT